MSAFIKQIVILDNERNEEEYLFDRIVHCFDGFTQNSNSLKLL